MRTRLGLDLGSNSIGWALVDVDSSQVIAGGVRVFPEGVSRDTQGGEVSKSEARRVARGARRCLGRRARRKRRLRRLLAQAGLLPPEAALRPADPKRIAWEKQAFDEADPYTLRRLGLDGPLQPHQIGRAILHIAQRRGFQSSRKTDKARKKETSDMLAEISKLEADIHAAGARTLGEHLAGLPDSDPNVRLRHRHTRRDMYEREFGILWSIQAAHHPQLLTDALHERVHYLIFHQRPHFVPKSVVGFCELERNPKRRRCPRADRRAQRLRMLQEVNNLQLIDEHGEERWLRPDERTRLLDYLAASGRRTFDDIRKHLGFLECVQFNLERGGRKSLLGMPTDKALGAKKCFGKAWDTLDEEQRNRIVRSLIEDDDATVLRRAREEWGLSEEQANEVLKADLPDGYAAFSREAIAKLLPHLEQGLLLMADDPTRCAITAAGYLRPDQRPHSRLPRLPQPPDLPNPIVRQALHEVRRVVNAVVREYGPLAEIHVELAREVKGSAERRKADTLRMRDNERRRDGAAEALRAFGTKPTRDGIDRYLLWQEQARVCPYTGLPIGLAQLLGGEVDVDHILPRSRSLDDSRMNKVVCFRSANADKGDRTPYEWLADSDPARYEQVSQRARKLPYYGKYRKFLQKEVLLDHFIHRQLTDTAYISRCVVQYLRCLVGDPYRDIVCGKGQLTAELRHQWGLETLLRELPDSPAWTAGAADLRPGEKDRSDHRHHFIDAAVIALTDRSRLQQLARQDQCPPPREAFRAEIAQLLASIRVSHRVHRKVSGRLHDETIYCPTGKEGVFVHRKPLEGLTLAEVECIRDLAVKARVLARLAEFGIQPGRKKRGGASGGRIPPEVWKSPLWMNQEKGIRIRKVRLEKKDSTIQAIRGGTAFVKPGARGTHHLCIFQMPDGKREAVFVTMLEAVRRAANGEPIIRREHPDCPDARFVLSLSSGEMLLGNWQGQERLLQYCTGASTRKVGQLYLVDPGDARPSAEKTLYRCNANTLDARKITVDPLGRVRWAND